MYTYCVYYLNILAKYYIIHNQNLFTLKNQIHNMNTLIIFLGLFGITKVLFFFYVFPLLKSGIHYERTKREKVETIINIVEKNKKIKNSRICDLGSGAGVILIPLAKKFPKSTFIGYEINPILTLYSKFKSRKIKNLKIKQKDFWKTNLKHFDIIILFQHRIFMKKIEEKARKECIPKTTIISNHWKFPNLKKIKTQNDIHTYKL